MDKRKVYEYLVSGADVWFYDKYGNARKARYRYNTLSVFDNSNKVIYETENIRLIKFVEEITDHLVGIW
jgi:hypothetical protein